MREVKLAGLGVMATIYYPAVSFRYTSDPHRRSAKSCEVLEPELGSQISFSSLQPKGGNNSICSPRRHEVGGAGGVNHRNSQCGGSALGLNRTSVFVK